jgi:CAAX prenyl protease N-terminal, five membrane helices
MVTYWILLRFGFSGKMRDFAVRVTRFTFLQNVIYWVQFVIVTTILGAPLAIYEDYFREHKYGLATQTFGPWLGDQLKALLVNMILGGILLALLFGLFEDYPLAGTSGAPSSPSALPPSR